MKIENYKIIKEIELGMFDFLYVKHPVLFYLNGIIGALAMFVNLIFILTGLTVIILAFLSKVTYYDGVVWFFGLIVWFAFLVVLFRKRKLIIATEGITFVRSTKFMGFKLIKWGYMKGFYIDRDYVIFIIKHEEIIRNFFQYRIFIYTLPIVWYLSKRYDFPFASYLGKEKSEELRIILLKYIPELKKRES